MGTSEGAVSTWAPLRIGIFRALWLAVLVSNIGTWMQTVGAQWLLVNQPHASILVALVQTADMLPDVLLAYVGGVLADTFDRRWLLIIVQGCLVIIGLVLTILTIVGQMPPALLLTLTFLLGAGSAFSVPAYQALIPDLVPRPQLQSASALGSINVNLARAIGPAIAGVLITRVGVGAVFAINTATFLVFGLVVAAWHPPADKTAPFPERFIPALRAGGRYVRYAPVVRRILIRSALFLVPASALWALLPLVATERLGLGANGYGLLLGALGVGAIAGAFTLPRHPRKAVEQPHAACCQHRLRGGTCRACTGTERRSDPGCAHTNGDRLDRRSLEHECRDATLPPLVGACPRPVGLSDGPLWRPGRWCRDLGCYSGSGGTRDDLSHCSGCHGRRGSDYPSLAPPRYERHGSQPGGVLARAPPGTRARPAGRTCARDVDLHHRPRERAAVPSGNESCTKVAAADRGGGVGTLSGW